MDVTTTLMNRFLDKLEMTRNMERRDFIKIAGAGALAMGAASVGCTPGKKAASGEEGPEQMVYRENPVNGDKVSLIGFGCMRLRLKKAERRR